MKCCAWEYLRASVAMSAIRRFPVRFEFAFGTAEKAFASATKAAVAAEPTVETNWRRVQAGAGFEVFILGALNPRTATRRFPLLLERGEGGVRSRLRSWCGGRLR